MEFRTNVKSVSALLDQFYEKRRLLIISTPSLMNQEYRLQNLMIQVRSSAHLIGYCLSSSRLNIEFCQTHAELQYTVYLCNSLTEIPLWLGPASRDRDRTPGFRPSRAWPD